jgi:hypothetical protein
MPDSDVWPPKPDLPDPLTKHDELIKEQMIALPGELPGLRLFNVLKVLRKERGLDWLSGFIVMQSYFQRYGAPPNPKRLTVFAFIVLGLAFPACLLQLYNVYLLFHREAILAQPNHQAALLVLDQEKHIIGLTVGVLLALAYIFLTIICGPMIYRKLRKKSGPMNGSSG